MGSRRSRSARVAAACWTAILLAVGSLTSGCYAMGKARGTLGIFDQRDPRVLYSVETEEPVVALTIDDGPDPATTPRILAVLEANGARATFFILSQRVAGNEAVVDAIHEAGHEIANHHRRDVPSIDLPRDQFVADLEESHRVLSRWSVPRWFRPGSGWYHDWMLDILDEHGYRRRPRLHLSAGCADSLARLRRLADSLAGEARRHHHSPRPRGAGRAHRAHPRARAPRARASGAIAWCP